MENLTETSSRNVFTIKVKSYLSHNMIPFVSLPHSSSLTILHMCTRVCARISISTIHIRTARAHAYINSHYMAPVFFHFLFCCAKTSIYYTYNWGIFAIFISCAVTSSIIRFLSAFLSQVPCAGATLTPFCILCFLLSSDTHF